jgi:urea transport system permease protein
MKNATKPLIIFCLFGILVPILNHFGIVSDNTLNLWGRYCCFAIAALGVDLIWGYTGILSLCQAFFFCLGGYAIGMHMLLKTGTKGVYGSALPDFMVWNQVEKLPLFWEPFHTFPISLIMVIVIPALIALVFGYLAFRSRLKGVYFAIITQALALAMWLIFLRNETMLGGTNGLTDFKTLLGFELSNPATKRGLYIVAFLTLFGAYYFSRFITNSKLGRILVAIRDGEMRLRFIGYPITHYKVFIFMVASAMAAIGGMLYVPQTGIITPGRMDVQASIEMVVWAAVGGRGTLIGPIMGAILINLLYSFLTGAFPGTWLYFLGFLFIGVVLFFPDGITGLWARGKTLWASRTKNATPSEPALEK